MGIEHWSDLINAQFPILNSHPNGKVTQIRPLEGPGNNVLEGTCTVCHNLDRVTSKQYDKDEWEGIVQSMRDKGAELSDDDATVLVEYLVKNFGKTRQ